MDQDFAHPMLSRNIALVAGVVVFHLLALWVLQSGLLHRHVVAVVSAEILSEFIEPPAPQVESPAAAPVPTTAARAKTPIPLKNPIPQATTLAVVEPAVSAATVLNSGPSPSADGATPVTEAPTASARVELPSSDADYLQNPKPPYPALSKRLGEQGKVVVRVLIGTDGTALKAEIRQSSGFDRLDQAAIGTALRWRYVPGKRAGVPESMWFNVPITFALE